MAFIEIETAETIHDVLSADSVFSSLIGTLHFDEATPDDDVPALIVSVNDAPIDGLDTAKGLVVVIEKDPTYRSQRLLTPGVIVDRLFTIRLLQFEANEALGETRSMRAAVERLLEIFPGSSAVNLGSPDQIAGDGQAVVRLPGYPVAQA